MNRTSGNGAASAAIAPDPPEASAGKNLGRASPASVARWMSVADDTPGNTGTPRA